MIQCGRHNDIFKFWLQWRSKGTAGFEFQMDRIMELAQYQVRFQYQYQYQIPNTKYQIPNTR